MYASRVNFRALKEIGVEEHDGDVRFRPEVEIRPFHACAMHPDSSFFVELAMGHTTFHRTLSSLLSSSPKRPVPSYCKYI